MGRLERPKEKASWKKNNPSSDLFPSLHKPKYYPNITVFMFYETGHLYVEVEGEEGRRADDF